MTAMNCTSEGIYEKKIPFYVILFYHYIILQQAGKQ